MRTSLILTLIISLFTTLHAQVSDEELINSYNNLADSLAQMADYKHAILLQKKSLNILQSQRKVNYAKLASAHRNVGYFYRLWGQYENSYSYQKKAIEIAEQRLDSNHIELAKAYNSLGSYYNSLGKYQDAYTYFNKALEISLRSGYATTGDFYNNVGIALQAHGDLNAALSTYQKALQYNLRVYGFNNEKTADNYFNLGSIYYDFGRYNEALSNLDTARIILEDRYDPGAPQFASLYNNLGAVYTTIGDYRNAIYYLEEGLNLYLRYLGPDHPEVANIYANTGLLLIDRGELDKALAYLKKALAIRESNFGSQNVKVASTMVYIGNCYLHKKYFEEASEYLQGGLHILLSLKDVAPSEIADARNDLGHYYEVMGNYDGALEQYNKALVLNAKEQRTYNPDIAKSYLHIGKVHLARSEFELAGLYFSKALGIRQHVYGPVHPEVADCYRLMALSHPGDPVKAVQHLKDAMRAIGYPASGKNAFEQVVSPLTLLNILQSRGELYHGFYLNYAEKKYLLEAEHSNEQAIDLIYFIKTSLEQPGSRLALQDNYYQVFELAIAVKYALQELTGDKKYWHESFAIAEKSNATLLLEALQAIDAERFAGIPDSLVQLERQYRLDLAFLEKQRFEEELRNGNAKKARLKEINDKILRLHDAQHRLISYFRENHPSYFDLKYESKTVGVPHLQQELLRDDQTMLSYFVGEESIFIFLISKNQFEVSAIRKEIPLEDWVEEFRRSIYNFNPADDTPNLLNQKFTNIGHELYQLLFKPVRDNIKTSALVIVPGGVLGYLPFDALLTMPSDNYLEFDDQAYLLNDFSISYTYSATLLDQMKNGRRHRSSPFIAFAPNYFGDTLQVKRSNDPWQAVLSRLRYNEEEAAAIHSIMGGELYLDSLATEERFVNRAPDAGILHLATHGKANDRHGEYSYLAFYQLADSLENELLFVKNLYNMNIPASMVVLSACETGIGELQRGEGIVSLARGFSFAGAASIITTLWSIDDHASASIMLDFYKHLREGAPKDVALRKAKLAYIRQNRGNNRTHPLFWAAFVPVGNMEPIQDGWPWWSWFIAAAALSGGALLLRKKINARSIRALGYSTT